MNKLVFTAAIAATLGLPAAAIAQTAPTTGTTGATIACRVPTATETPNATIGTAKYVCKPIDMTKVRAAMSSAMADLTPAQKAKLDYAMQVLQDEMLLHPTNPGTNGNPNN